MSKLFDDSSLAMIPSAVKDGRLYSIRPVPEYGSEVLSQPVDIDTDFIANSGGVIIDANTFTTAGGSNDGIIKYNLIQANKQYRLEIQGTTTSSGFTIGNGQASGNEYGTGFGVHYFTSASANLWIRQITAGITDITTFSIKEVSNIGDFTFSRGSNLAATRVDVNGLIEKGRENLLLQSNNFATTWVAVNSSITSGQIGYDGSSDASLLTAASSGANIYQLNSSTGVLSLSVYAKANVSNWIRLRFDNSPSADVNTWINLLDGSIGSDGGIATNVESVGGEWYRITSQVNTTDLNNVRIYPADSDGNNSTSGSIYIQNAQLEQGLVATDYIETGASTAQSGILEDLPRLDYSGGASCPSLLLEPQRSNLLSQSEYVNGSPDVSNSTITSNAATSPEGLVNASKVVPNTSNIFHWFGQVINSQTSGNYTQSIFAKADTYNHLFMVIRTDSGSKRYGVKFNLSNGTFVDDITFGSPTQTNYSIEDYGNGWYRCSISANHSSGAVIALFGASLGGALSDINNGFAGDGTSGIYVYGAQLEAGSYPTSYIPTYGSAVTGGADNCRQSPLATLSNNYSIFAEVTRTATTEINNLEFIDYSSSSNDRLRIYTYNNGRIRFRTYFNDGTNDSYFTNSGDWNQGDTIKFCFTYDNGDIVIYANGEQLHSISQTLNNLNYLNMETQIIKQLLHFETTLTSSEAIALTTI